MKTKKKKQGAKTKVKTKAKSKLKAGAKKNTKAKVSALNDKHDTGDIVRLILQDHKPLKKFIELMKDTGAEFSKRKNAFEEFAQLLKAHSTAEEQALYSFMEEKPKLLGEALEAEVQHNLADQMVEESKSTQNEDLMSAKIKVLAELVEHHIEEEESQVLPDFKKETDSNVRIEIGEKYLQLKSQAHVEAEAELQEKKTEQDEPEDQDPADAQTNYLR